MGLTLTLALSLSMSLSLALALVLTATLTLTRAHWRRASAERCTVRIFHPRHLKNGDIVDDFLHTFIPHVAWLCAEKAAPQNAGLPSEVLLFLWVARRLAKALGLRSTYCAAHDVVLPQGAMWEPLFGDFVAAMQAVGASRFELPAEVLADLARRYPANERVWHGEHEAVGDAVETGGGQLTFWGLFGGVRWGRIALAMLWCLPKASCRAVARAVGASSK